MEIREIHMHPLYDDIPEESVEPTVIADDDPREVETSLPVLMLFLLFFEEWFELTEEVVEEPLEFSVLDSSVLLLSLFFSDDDFGSKGKKKTLKKIIIPK